MMTTILFAYFTRNENVSHIAAGYWYNSASLGKVRVDESYDGAFASSLFDYTNTTSDGGVLNKLWTVSPSVGSQPTCFSEHIPDPGFPLVTADILKQAGASFGGVTNDQWIGYSQTVSSSCRGVESPLTK